MEMNPETRLLITQELKARLVLSRTFKGCDPECELIRIPGVGLRAVAKKGNKRYPLEGQEHRPCSECMHRRRNQGKIEVLRKELGFQVDLFVPPG